MAENSIIGQQVQGYCILEKLGSGGYGTVYLAEKEDLGKKYQTAIKHISLPDAEGYNAVLQDYSYDRSATEAHFENMVESITAEINTLLELSKKDNRYVVAYYDHEIQKSQDPLHYDVFMRMEYLTPLNSHVRSKGITLGEIIRLGLNMCDALSLCHSSGVIHRDIKEANIFISENGNFKLGDFGVAKAALEATQSGSVKGTASYMAPEVYFREAYDGSVDIYSLGIVLYKLLNNQRLPFMPDAPDPFSVEDKNLALTRRLKGEVPPLPANAKNQLGQIVVKACSVKSERYAHAEELKADLQLYLKTITREEYDAVVVPPSSDPEGSDLSCQDPPRSYTYTQSATAPMGAAVSGVVPPPIEQNPYADTGSKGGTKRRSVRNTLAAVLILAAGAAAFVVYLRFTDPVRQFQSAITDLDFSGAAQLYQEKIRDGDAKKVEQVKELIIVLADDVKTKYINEEIDYETALAQLQEMGKLGIISSEGLQPVIAQINDLRTSRVAYENAQIHIEINDWKSAINELRKVIQADSNYAEAQVQLAEAIRCYKDELLAAVQDLDADGDHEGALTALQAGLQVVPDDADFLAKVQDVEKKIEDSIKNEIDSIIQQARAEISVSGDYIGALTTLRNAGKQYPASEEIKTAVGEIEDEYLVKVLADAETIANEGEYRQAVTMLNEALKTLPNNTAIKTAVSAYEAKYPVLLQQLVYFTGRNLENGGQETDNLQQMQTNVIQTDAGGRFDNTYKLDGKYTRITGVLYQPFDYRSEKYVRTFEIFGDGRLLFSAKMSGGIEPISFDVDLSGVSDFEIKLDNENYNYAYAKLANVELYQ